MRLAEVLARADRLQQGVRFKVIASIVVLAVALGGYIALIVAAKAPGVGDAIAIRAIERARQASAGTLIDAGPGQALRLALDSLLLAVRPIDSAVQAPAGPDGQPSVTLAGVSNEGMLRAAAVFAGAALGVCAVVWLGLFISYLALFVLGWGVAWPLMLWPPTAAVGQLILAAVPLMLAFLAGMALLRLAFSGPWPVMAVARNLLFEAVRMKISIVFIVLLILLLSYVPQSLNETQPLRYRVQSWLSWGTGLSYAVLALLTLFLSVATVAFEQRDKIIWQTMSKPVAPWQYLLGKWLGVLGLNAVLLTVTASGVFLFTEYLRRQPAHGEITFHVRADGALTLGRPDLMTEDRRLLESQVLVARQSRQMAALLGDEMLRQAARQQLAVLAAQDQTIRDTPGELRRIESEMRGERERMLSNAVSGRIDYLRSADPTVRDTPALRAELLQSIVMEQESLYRTVPPGGSKVFFFTGLSAARAPEAPQKVTLRYRVNAGSNDPSAIYRVRMYLNGRLFERQVALAAAQTLLFDKDIIDDNGNLAVEVQSSAENPREMSFPPGGLEVLYVAGGYEVNFVRIMLVMWVKLAFIAAVGISAATFLSFPVACLVAMTVMLAAESAGFLRESLEYYVSQTTEGIDWMAVAVRVIAVPVSMIFSLYADLRPTEKLVDGRLVGWDSLMGSVAVLGGWSLGVLGIGWSIFRNRELGTYSGR